MVAATFTKSGMVWAMKPSIFSMFWSAFYLFDVLVHRFLDGSRGSVVQIPQRQFADMLGQADTQPIQDTESSHMRGHQSSIEQYQSADKPSKRYPSPAHHIRPV